MYKMHVINIFTAFYIREKDHPREYRENKMLANKRVYSILCMDASYITLKTSGCLM